LILQPRENEGRSAAENMLAKTQLIDRAGHARTGPVDIRNLMPTSSTASS
jgi:hypothetical protein